MYMYICVSICLYIYVYSVCVSMCLYVYVYSVYVIICLYIHTNTCLYILYLLNPYYKNTKILNSKHLKYGNKNIKKCRKILLFDL